MRKQMLFVLLTVAVMALSGCGKDDIGNTIDTMEYESDSEIETTINDKEISDKETSDNDSLDKETINELTTEETTTTKKEETTSKEETTTVGGSEKLPGVDDFDVNADRVQLPGDKILSGDDFSDAVFIGDSRTEGLTVYNVLTTSTIVATRGLMASEAYSKKFVNMGDGTKGTAIDYIKGKNFNRVYIMLGLNEMGGTVDNFSKTYGVLIDKIHEALPAAKIYAISIIPMIEDRTDETYNNPKIKKFNEALIKLVEQKNITYVNAKAAVINEQGTLRNDLSKDGIHLKPAGLTMFVNYLILSTSESYADR